jgi:hypothetical protein
MDLRIPSPGLPVPFGTVRERPLDRRRTGAPKGRTGQSAGRTFLQLILADFADQRRARSATL